MAWGLYAPGAGVCGDSFRKRLVVEAKAAERTRRLFDALSRMCCGASCEPGPGRTMAACAARSDGSSMRGVLEAKEDEPYTARSWPLCDDAGE